MFTDIAHPKLQIHWEKLDFFLDSESVFEVLFAKAETAFWLDSPEKTSGRFSFMGDVSGPHAAWCEYSLQNKKLVWHGSSSAKQRSASDYQLQPQSLFDFLRQTLKAREQDSAALPFDFNGGFVGYLGFELKAECGYEISTETPTEAASIEPDACFIFADRFVAFDHKEKSLYLVENCSPVAENSPWIASTKFELEKISSAAEKKQELKPVAGYRNIKEKKRISDSDYLEKIAEIKHLIQAGETYEACLTNQLVVETEAEPLALYRVLRALNPAPYGSFFRFHRFAIVSASPELFLYIDKLGRVTTKPIKGTRARSASAQEDATLRRALEQSEKDRAENLMIVDLLRNDLGKVSQVGSVKVSELFAVESFATVHQMVSTIESQLAKGNCAVDCVQACFPGGSMTGAPKKRTLEILEQMEPGPRGIYSGAIGYFALNGSAHLNIVIRSIVLASGCAKIGVGGAIIDASDAKEELEEVNIKAGALLQALSHFS